MKRRNLNSVPCAITAAWPLTDRRAKLERRSQVELAGVPLWTVRAEDLILLKPKWSREPRSEQQRRDVRLLLQAPLDRAYLAHWAAQLDLDGLGQGADNERHQP